MRALSHQGDFSLGLWPGVDFSTLAPVPYSLFQSGNVPADARTIRFFNFGLPLELGVNGTVVLLFYSNVQSTVPPTIIGSATFSQMCPFLPARSLS